MHKLSNKPSLKTLISCCLQGVPEGEDSLPPYQEDILRNRGPAAGARTSWEAGGSTPGASWTTGTPREVKTSSRTYTDPEGNVVTEVSAC